jgi:O-antigen/teichoic acid export membrane protein
MMLSPVTRLLGRFLARVGVDRAILYGLLGTAQVFLIGPVTALIIVLTLTTELQGYYYTFSALLLLQIFLEMGFSQVIVQFASHEWAHLRLRPDRTIDGDADADALSRLSSLARMSTTWYAWISALLGIGLAVTGVLFFSSAKGSDHVVWLGPWILFAVLTAVEFTMIPLWALLQGANQMAAVNLAKLISGLLLVPVLWGSLLLGAGLWSLALAKFVSVSWDVGVLARYGKFYGTLLRKRAGPTMKWRREILPVQWRIALSCMSGYFAFQIFVPVIFRYEGPAEAGRWGMTWGVVMAVAALSTTWIYTRFPAFGSLIAQRRYAELDAAFRKTTLGAVGLCGLASSLALGAIAGFHATDLKFADRLLPTGTAACLFAGSVIMQISSAQSAYLRAHKAEPFLVLSLLNGALVVSTTLAFGAIWGTAGIAAGYLAVTVLVILPLSTRLFMRLRRDWHAPQVAPDYESRAVAT